MMQWYDHLCQEQTKASKQTGEIFETPMTGAIFAYTTLAYNLYLIAHNIHLVHGEGLHARLVDRLRNPESFYPAFYETMVAASFIKAGFHIELENEGNPSSQHAEFTATSPKTQRKYSVEAKHRQAGKVHTGIKKQLVKALKKDLPHMHVVFINLNVPDNIITDGRLNWLGDVIDQMRGYENTITTRSKPAPQAYIFVTNHPFLYNLDSFAFPPAAVAEGFRIPDFRIDCAFSNLKDALKSREKHIDMLDLMKAMKEYDRIPCTFDGTIPEYSLGEIKNPRLIIGNKYLVPDSEGKDVEGILIDAIVMEDERKVMGVYRLDGGKQIIATCPLSEQEYTVFKQNPDTFFGIYKKHSNKARDALDLYDFFHSTYKKSSKQKLLQFMESHPDYQSLKDKSQEELAIIYCERLVYWAMKRKS